MPLFLRYNATFFTVLPLFLRCYCHFFYGNYFNKNFKIKNIIIKALEKDYSIELYNATGGNWKMGKYERDNLSLDNQVVKSNKMIQRKI